MLLAKTKLNTIEILIYKVLADSSISHDEFVSINIVLNMKEEIKDYNNKYVWCNQASTISFVSA